MENGGTSSRSGECLPADDIRVKDRLKQQANLKEMSATIYTPTHQTKGLPSKRLKLPG